MFEVWVLVFTIVASGQNTTFLPRGNVAIGDLAAMNTVVIDNIASEETCDSVATNLMREYSGAGRMKYACLRVKKAKAP